MRGSSRNDSAMSSVTKDEFFAALYADSRDIMPTIVNRTWPYVQEWRNQKSSARELFGRSCEDAYELAVGNG